MKKRTIICMLLALVLVFGSVAACYADVASFNFTTTRKSNTLATVTASASFDKTASTCSATMTLLERYGSNSWRTATGVPVKTASASKTNAKIISLTKNFTLVKGKVYKVKVVFKDKNASGTFSETWSSNVF